MHYPIPKFGKWLRSVVQGYYNYHGVPYNLPQLYAFRHHLSRAWLKMLRRRSQKARQASSPLSTEAGAVCGNSACTDLRGGCPVRGIPTMTVED